MGEGGGKGSAWKRVGGSSKDSSADSSGKGSDSVEEGISVDGSEVVLAAKTGKSESELMAASSAGCELVHSNPASSCWTQCRTSQPAWSCPFTITPRLPSPLPFCIRLLVQSKYALQHHLTDKFTQHVLLLDTATAFKVGEEWTVHACACGFVQRNMREENGRMRFGGYGEGRGDYVVHEVVGFGLEMGGSRRGCRGSSS